MVQYVKKIVDCLRGGQVIGSYPLTYVITDVPSDPPDLIKEARDSLILEGVIKPPFDFAGIEYRIRDWQ
jgi:hypothetical protein